MPTPHEEIARLTGELERAVSGAVRFAQAVADMLDALAEDADGSLLGQPNKAETKAQRAQRIAAAAARLSAEAEKARAYARAQKRWLANARLAAANAKTAADARAGRVVGRAAPCTVPKPERPVRERAAAAEDALHKEAILRGLLGRPPKQDLVALARAAVEEAKAREGQVPQPGALVILKMPTGKRKLPPCNEHGVDRAEARRAAAEAKAWREGAASR